MFMLLRTYVSMMPWIILSKIIAPTYYNRKDRQQTFTCPIKGGKKKKKNAAKKT